MISVWFREDLATSLHLTVDQLLWFSERPARQFLQDLLESFELALVVAQNESLLAAVSSLLHRGHEMLHVPVDRRVRNQPELDMPLTGKQT